MDVTPLIQKKFIFRIFLIALLFILSCQFKTPGSADPASQGLSPDGGGGPIALDNPQAAAPPGQPTEDFTPAPFPIRAQGRILLTQSPNDKECEPDLNDSLEVSFTATGWSEEEPYATGVLEVDPCGHFEINDLKAAMLDGECKVTSKLVYLATYEEGEQFYQAKFGPLECPPDPQNDTIDILLKLQESLVYQAPMEIAL